MANADLEGHMRYLLQQIATGPELSKDVSREEAQLGMQSVLHGQVHPVQAALYLIALRMKRETDEELLGIQQALLDATSTATAEVEELVEIADPFNGYLRGLPVSPFLPAVLAACGVPCVSHGVESTGPKHGITHHKVLAALGVDTGMGLSEAAERIGNSEIGWAYVDQSVTCPDLNRMGELRDLMVKRTCLTTIEVALKPIAARCCTHLVTGYVHKAYPRIYTMLARNAGYQSALVIRGVEGGVIPSLQQPSRGIRYYGGVDDEDWRFDPGESGISDSEHRTVPLPRPDSVGERERKDLLDVDSMASAAAESGMDALRGVKGPAYDSLVYAGSLVLAHLGRGSQRDAAEEIRKVLDDGVAAAKMSF
ncbi:anthranilate phosphoribosyltransferase [Pseudomonadota bacterium]